MTFGAQNGNLSRRVVCALDPAAQPGVAWSVRHGRFWAWAAVAAAILGICIATLHSRGGGSTTAGWSFYLTTGDAAFADLIANLILFIPLGVALTIAGVRPLRVIAAGAVLSCTVEFLQQWIPGRDPSLGDIVANTNSTALGVLLVVAAPIWLFVPSRRSTWQALITAIIAVLVWWGTAFMLRQTAPPLPYDVVLTPDFRYFGHYNGRVIDVRPAKTGGRLDITAIAATEPPSQTSPLIAILDKRGAKVLMLSVDHADLTLRYHMPALDATLDQPDLRLRGALRGIAPGDTFTAATWHDSTDICLQLNSTQRCGLGHTIGVGWKLIYNPQSWPPWALALINTLWTAGCVIGVGFWGLRGDSAAIRRIAIAIAILGALIVPLATHLNATTLYEFLGVLGGIVAGRRLARLTLKGRLDTPGPSAARYTAPPAHPLQTS